MVACIAFELGFFYFLQHNCVLVLKYWKCKTVPNVWSGLLGYMPKDLDTLEATLVSLSDYHLSQEFSEQLLISLS